MMPAIDQVLTLADAFERHESIGDSTLSWRLFGDSKKLAAIRKGADLQSRRLEKALAWFAANWPAGRAWPRRIQRPAAPARKNGRAKLPPSRQRLEA